MTRRRVVRSVGLLALVLTATGVGIVSVERSREQLAALEACEAVRTGDHARALALTEGRGGPDATGREVATCRCHALVSTGKGAACDALMLELLADERSDDWAPEPALAAHLIGRWRDQGRLRDAALLARRAGAMHPRDPLLFRLELETRGALEEERALLDELARRIPEQGDAAARMRATLGMRHLHAGDPAAALLALGEQPPAGAGEGLGIWFDTRGIALAYAADLEATRLNYAAWTHAGGDPAEVEARYAVALSMAGLEDPDVSVLERLRRAASSSHDLPPALQETLAIRLILTLVNAGEIDEALSTHEVQAERVAMEGMSRAELERAARHRELAHAPSEARRGTLRFELPLEAAGGALWLSPEPDAPSDADYTRLPIELPIGAGDSTAADSPTLRAQRSAGSAPQRWVVRDADGVLLGSGTVSPWPGSEVAVMVRARPARPAPPVYEPARGPADGQRRVALLLLDCGDWRITRYLEARGELPVLTHLIRNGQRAVLHSDPPLTAAALEALVWPGRRAGGSFVGTMHRMGVELAGLSSIGDNPFAALSWVMPASQDLFSVLGASAGPAANLLLSHGGIQAGRHGEVSGPQGERDRVPIGSAARDLRPDERERFPELAAALPARDALHLRTIAAELDVARELARDTSIRFVALRIEPLDILTHAHFAQSVRDGQDDARGLLFETYRYIDARIAEVSDALDQDDVLIVMSDHGIETAMEHSHDAMWIAHGGGVPSGRTEGRPIFAGVSRAIADLLEVPTAWPDSGVAPWAAGAVVLPANQAD